MQPNAMIYSKIPKERLIRLLRSIGGIEREYRAGEYMILQGENHKFVSFLVDGTAHASRSDVAGREADYTSLLAGTFFGDILALSEEEKSPVSVLADTTCRVIDFPYDALLNSDDPDAAKLLQILLISVSERFFKLQKRVFCLTRGTLREKIAAFLNDQRDAHHADEFTIPFDRDAMAAYLYCDRSALSRELSAMKAEGLIDYRKNRFVILKHHFLKND